ncbi:hypothetical protein HLK59_23095 [Streptomyces sp. S3(2020)]|uniref:hypothetical protein n=1 Tax=Streptomyces sp. S3(2020) TaxID=2732044 RepID=UPI00148934EF|nr:hypothetical protein [Streptomyces sp. S3(2020)]NNN33191.1 hypothetical protein [Streptomyces sp. S3(2020)]
MSEKNDRPKPPTRRTGGRALGGTKKTTPPPPPPTAELTPEQFAAEQDTAQGEMVGAGTPRVEHTPAAAAFEAPAQNLTEAVEAAEARTESADGLAERQPRPVALAPQSEALGSPPNQPAESDDQDSPPHAALALSGTAPTAEVAIRQAVTPAAAGTAFPFRPDGPVSHQAQKARAQEAPSEGAPYAHGPGRPENIPEAAVVLNQRIITRESLDSSAPAALKLKKRIKRFALDNELDHLPIGDIVSVALDEWLTARGF